MADDSKNGLGRGLALAIVAAVLVGGGAVLYVMGGATDKPASSAALKPAAKGTMAKLQEAAPKPPPVSAFVDGAGKTMRISDFKGQVVVVNLWATWCAPCKKEMPTLAALQRAYAGKPVKVVAISIDQANATEEAKAFIAANAPLEFYQDSTMKLPFDLQPPAPGFPTTILFDRFGQERARLIGDADWSTEDARAVVDRLLAAPG